MQQELSLMRSSEISTCDTCKPATALWSMNSTTKTNSQEDYECVMRMLSISGDAKCNFLHSVQPVALQYLDVLSGSQRNLPQRSWQTAKFASKPAHPSFAKINVLLIMSCSIFVLCKCMCYRRYRLRLKTVE